MANFNGGRQKFIIPENPEFRYFDSENGLQESVGWWGRPTLEWARCSRKARQARQSSFV
jgi:hypothetical protein